MIFKQFKSFLIEQIKTPDGQGYLIPDNIKQDILNGVIDVDINKHRPHILIEPFNYITYQSYLAIKDWLKYTK